MPLYESLFFIRGKCQPTEIVSSLTKAAKCVTSNGGVIRQLDNLGKRPLGRLCVRGVAPACRG